MGSAEIGDGDPRQLGEWRVVSKLGDGGMGSVYLGESEGRHVALKTLHPSIAARAGASDRFSREYSAAGRVRSPYVAEVIGADLDAERPFLAIEYVSGVTLEDYVDQHGRLAGVDLARFGYQLALGLEAMHDVGVTHRDLKPSNVVMTRRGPVIIDFGIALVADGHALTQTAQVMGSPGWTSPEHLMGEPIGPEADVFGWGALMHFAATGHNPFGDGTPQAQMYRIANGSADPHGIEGDLGRLVTETLRKVAHQRPLVTELVRESGELVDNRALAGASPAAAPVGNVAQAEASTSRLRRFAPAAMAVVFAAVVAFGLLVFPGTQRVQAPTDSEVAVASTSGAADADEGQGSAAADVATTEPMAESTGSSGQQTPVEVAPEATAPDATAPAAAAPDLAAPDDGAADATASAADGATTVPGEERQAADDSSSPDPDVTVAPARVSVDVAGRQVTVDCDGAAIASLAPVNEVNLAPGMVVEFVRACTFLGPLSIEDSGTEAEPITVRSQAPAAEDASLPALVVNAGGERPVGAIIDVFGSHVVIQDIRIHGRSSGVSPKCDASALGWVAGIQLNAGAANNRIERVAVRDAHAGVFIDDGAVDNEIIESRFIGNTMLNESSGANGVLIFGDDNLVAFSYFEAHEACGSGAAIEVFEGTDNQILNNSGVDNQVFVELHGQNTSPTTGNEIADNLATSTVKRGVFARITARNVDGPASRFLHNTMVMTGSGGKGLLCFRCEGERLVFANNIVVANTAIEGEGDDQAYTGGSNLFWGPEGDAPLVDAEVLVAAGSASNLIADPLFHLPESGDFRVAPCSPAVDAAVFDAEPGAQIGARWVGVRGESTEQC